MKNLATILIFSLTFIPSLGLAREVSHCVNHGADAYEKSFLYPKLPKYLPRGASSKADVLFTSTHGIILGETLVTDVLGMGGVLSRQYAYVNYDGHNFWFNKYDQGYVDSMYFTRGASSEDRNKDTPLHLRIAGLEFGATSYSGAIRYLVKMGFVVCVGDPPQQKYYEHAYGFNRGGDAFFAELIGIALTPDGREVGVVLTFGYAAGDRSSQETLYSINLFARQASQGGF